MTDHKPTDKSRLDKLALGLGIIAVPASIASGATPAEALVNDTPTEQIRTIDADGASAGASAKATADGPATASLPHALTSKSADTYRVRAGDTLSGIASKHGITLNALLRLNQLHDKSVILPGQVLRLNATARLSKAQQAASQTKQHLVASGETLSSIAKKHGVQLEAILALNNLKPSAIIFPGQKLLIGTVAAQAAPEKSQSTTHVVAAGETIVSIARKHGLSQSSLLKFNNLKAASIIYAGQTLLLTASSNSTGAVSADSSTGSQGTTALNPCRVHGYHKVKAGETASKIAAVFGVSTQSLLSANKLGWSSPIFIGQKLQIPGGHSAQDCPNVFPLTQQMLPNAKLIVSIGRELGVSDFGIVVALAAAAQESGVINLDHGDRDSLGLFQQRPSVGWGSKQQLQTPEFAIRAFYGGPTGPNCGKISGLLDIKGWTKMKVTEAAQAVQVSAYPNAYAKWENSAWVWLDQLGASQND